MSKWWTESYKFGASASQDHNGTYNRWSWSWRFRWRWKQCLRVKLFSHSSASSILKPTDWWWSASQRSKCFLLFLQVTDSKVAVQVNARAVGVARPIVWNLVWYIFQKEDKGESDDGWFHDENIIKSEENLIIEPAKKELHESKKLHFENIQSWETWCLTSCYLSNKTWNQNKLNSPSRKLTRFWYHDK